MSKRLKWFISNSIDSLFQLHNTNKTEIFLQEFKKSSILPAAPLGCSRWGVRLFYPPRSCRTAHPSRISNGKYREAQTLDVFHRKNSLVIFRPIIKNSNCRADWNNPHRIRGIFARWKTSQVWRSLAPSLKNFMGRVNFVWEHWCLREVNQKKSRSKEKGAGFRAYLAVCFS